MGKKFEPVPNDVERAGKALLDAAYYVHTQLGPGLLESVYEECLIRTLRKRGVQAANQVSLPITFDGETLETGLRIDVLVENSVIAELKSVDTVPPIVQSQLLTYLRLTGQRLGFLVNFNVIHLRDGIQRMVN